jgi:hypothetical protein
MRKLLTVATVALACLVCSAASAAAAGPKSSPPKLTIEAVPGGAFGLVKARDVKSCAAGRKVVVFRQLGDAPDADDPRAAADRAAQTEPGTYQWSVDLEGSGNFYARAAAKRGCPAIQSAVVESQAPAAILGADSGPSYPTCSPYVSEGTSEICRFDQLYVDLEQEGPFNPCRFGPSSGGCPGRAQGLFPWGFGRPRTQVSWHQSGPVRVLEIASSDNAGRLDGHLPSSGSNRFTVTNGFARNDRGGGDNFYTPDLPGQAPGEVGGPLSLNFENGSGTDFGAQVWVSGYLYLKH